MANSIIDIRGKKIARSNVTLVEPFDPERATAVPDAERFKGRVRMKDATSMLIEQTPSDFARAPDVGFRHLGAPDDIATNPDITYRVEAFDLAEAQRRNPEFQPEREFATRLSCGKGGKGESVLLVNGPDHVAAVVLMGQPDRGSRGASRAQRVRSRLPIQPRAHPQASCRHHTGTETGRRCSCHFSEFIRDRARINARFATPARATRQEWDDGWVT
jgi:hypothetical protein